MSRLLSEATTPDHQPLVYVCRLLRSVEKIIILFSHGVIASGRVWLHLAEHYHSSNSDNGLIFVRHHLELRRQISVPLTNRENIAIKERAHQKHRETR